MLAVTSHPAKAGFTLIELMITLALAAILLTLAAPTFQRTLAMQKVTATSSDLLASIMQARNEAITNNQQTIVQPLVEADWSRGWRVYVDGDRNNTYSAANDTLIATVQAAAENVQALSADVALNTTLGNFVGFDASGYLLGRNAGRIVFSSKFIPAAEYKKGVKVAVTGRARVCSTSPESDGCAASAN